MVGQATGWDTADVVVQWLASGERRPLVRGSDARVLPTGHLVYALGNVLYAVPFDPAAMEVVGGPIPVVQGVQRAVRGSGGHGGSANYDISRTGTLVYVRESFRVGAQDLRLLSVDRSGNADAFIDEPRNYWRPRISSGRGARVGGGAHWRFRQTNLDGRSEKPDRQPRHPAREWTRRVDPGRRVGHLPGDARG